MVFNVNRSSFKTEPVNLFSFLGCFYFPRRSVLIFLSKPVSQCSEKYVTLHYGPEQKKTQQNLIIHFPTSLRVSELASEQTSEQCERMSKQENGQANGTILSSGFLVDLAHSAKGLLRSNTVKSSELDDCEQLHCEQLEPA